MELTFDPNCSACVRHQAVMEQVKAHHSFDVITSDSGRRIVSIKGVLYDVQPPFCAYHSYEPEDPEGNQETPAE